MTEWGVVTVIVVLIGLVAAIVKPLLNLNATITRLTVVVDILESNVSSFTSKNSEAHGRIWDELDQQGDKLAGHETRISVLEQK